MRHTEIPDSPCQKGYCRQRRIGDCRSCHRVMDCGEGEIAGQRLCIVHNSAHAACVAHTKGYDGNKRDGHDDTLDQVVGGNRGESSHNRIDYDNNCKYNNSGHVIQITAESAVMMFFSSWNLLAKNVGTVIAPILSEYRLNLLDVKSQFRYVPIARPAAVQKASARPVR